MSQSHASDPIVLWSVSSVALGKEAQDAVTPGLQLIVSARPLCRMLTTDHQCQDAAHFTLHRARGLLAHVPACVPRCASQPGEMYCY